MYKIITNDDVEKCTWRAVVIQIRKSRAKLGSILDWLENTESDPDVLDSLSECADSIRAEVDRMVVTIAVLPPPEKNHRSV